MPTKAEQEEECLCPLCLEELDLTDRSFKPCQCGYQICLFCFYSINEKVNGKCPACRTPYQQKKIESSGANFDIYNAARAEHSQKKKEKEKERKKVVRPKTPIATTIEAKDVDTLQHLRIMQRNLVYLVGLPVHLAKEDLLRSDELFGRFGEIVKIAINMKNVSSSGHRPTCSAYVTFDSKDDAQSAIHHFNGRSVENRTVKATYGTTKYCTFFLRNIVCTNSGCLYLHRLASKEDCFTKEQLASVDRFGDTENLYNRTLSDCIVVKSVEKSSVQNVKAEAGIKSSSSVSAVPSSSSSSGTSTSISVKSKQTVKPSYTQKTSSQKPAHKYVVKSTSSHKTGVSVPSSSSTSTSTSSVEREERRAREKELREKERQKERERERERRDRREREERKKLAERRKNATISKSRPSSSSSSSSVSRESSNPSSRRHISKPVASSLSPSSSTTPTPAVAPLSVPKPTPVPISTPIPTPTSTHKHTQKPTPKSDPPLNLNPNTNINTTHIPTSTSTTTSTPIAPPLSLSLSQAHLPPPLPSHNSTYSQFGPPNPHPHSHTHIYTNPHTHTQSHNTPTSRLPGITSFGMHSYQWSTPSSSTPTSSNPHTHPFHQPHPFHEEKDSSSSTSAIMTDPAVMSFKSFQSHSMRRSDSSSSFIVDHSDAALRGLVRPPPPGLGGIRQQQQQQQQTYTQGNTQGHTHTQAQTQGQGQQSTDTFSMNQHLMRDHPLFRQF